MSAATRSTSVDRNLAWRVSPGAGSPTPTRHPFKGFDDGPVEKRVEGPQARGRRLRMRPGATAGNRMLTRFARRSAAIADAPEAPGCLGSGLASKPRPGRLGEAPGLGSGLGRGNPARGALRPRSLGRPPWGFLMG